MAKIQSKEERDRLFGEAPIGKALAAMAMPTIVAQLINLIYSLADTFFVGQTGNPYMIGSISLAFSLFMFNVPISGLFGIGGGSYLARLLGVKKYEKVENVSAWCFYGALTLAVIYSLSIFTFLDKILVLLGASENTMAFAKQYVFVVVILGTTPTVLSATLAHMLRNVGYSKQASFGLSLGGILNMIFDPLFMYILLPDGYQVVGAAVATALSNTCALVYFIVTFTKTRKETFLSLSPKDAKMSPDDIKEVLKIGIPSAATTLLLDFSHTYLNANMAAYGDFHIAALGIENKIERLSNSVNLGIAQAMLPLVAFNYSAGNEKRTRGFIRTARIAGFCVSIFSILFYQSMARPLVTLFIKTRGGSADVSATIALAITYLRIRCFAAPVSMLNYVAVNGFQAMGDGKLSLAHSIFKQIVLYFPLMVVLNHFFGVTGLILALPITEAVSSVVATVLIQKKLNRASKEGHFNKIS